MDVTATEAKNRLGQMLEHCQREPVVIEKSGRRHSVLLSAEQYDRLVAVEQATLAQRGQAADSGTGGRAASRGKSEQGRAFYAQHQAWVDHVNSEVQEHGLWNDELRVW